MNKLIDIPDDWYQHLKETIESPYFKSLGAFVARERKTKSIFPYKDEVFKAFNLTPFHKVRVVILGMDPYPGKSGGEPIAHGLAFSPRQKSYVTPSLRMIYNRIKADIYPDDLSFPTDMNIESWAKQGVLMLNAPLINGDLHHVLTAPHPASAVYKGEEWECNHFKRINEILMANNPDDIDWLENLK